MEIKDRVAINDNVFLMRVLEEKGEFKRIALVRTPTKVIEKGTPINKELLQPLVDAIEVVDISDDFAEVIQQEDFVNEVTMDVKKCGNVVSGAIALANHSGTGFLERFELKINSKYASAIPSVHTGITGDKNEKLSGSSVLVVINDTDVIFEWIQDPSNFVAVQFSFTYLCKGDTVNGDS